MSANYPPPQQPGPNQSPYAQPPASPYAQQQQPFGGQPGFNGAAYPPPTAPAQGNPALAIVVAVGATVVAALVYGLIIKSTKHELGWVAMGVGALIGLAIGRIGGRNPLLHVLGIPLALLGVYLGQMYGIALLASGDGMSTTDIFLHHFSLLQKAWKESMDGKDVLFFILAGLEAFVIARRVAR